MFVTLSSKTACPMMRRNRDQRIRPSRYADAALANHPEEKMEHEEEIAGNKNA